MRTGDSNRLRTWLCGTAAVAALAAVTPVAAQNKPGEAEAGESTVSEVVVTAQRREQPLSEVPITVTVQSGEQLEQAGVDDMRDLNFVVPGFRMDQVGIISQPTIRGVTTLVSTPGNDPSVVTYIDGIYQSAQGALTFELPDVQQIEVLKGPQGTLFGRNAQGGAVLITTYEPKFTPTGKAVVGYGSHNDLLAQGYIAGPIIGDKLAGSLSAYHRQNDGYIDNLGTGETVGKLESTSIRGKLNLVVSDDVRLQGVAYYKHRIDQTSSWLQPLNGNTVARRIVPGTPIPDEPWEALATPGVEPELENTGWGASLKADINFGFARLTSSVSGTDAEDIVELDGDQALPAIAYLEGTQEHRNFVQENILRSTGDGRFSWLVGTFYWNERARFNPLILGGPKGALTNTLNRTELHTTAYAGFADVEFQATDRLTLIAGVRVSHEEKSLDGASGNVGFPPLDPLPFVGEREWDSVTPRAVARFKVTEDINAYVNYSEGFKSGLFSASSPINFAADPEKMKALEVGAKITKDRWSLNASAYRYELEGQQLPAWIGVGAALLSRVINATDATIHGLELDGTFAVTDNFTLRAGLSLLETEYGTWRNATVQVPNPAAVCAAAGAPFPCGNITILADVSGNQVPRSPNWTFTTTADYERDFAYGTWGASATVFGSDNVFYDVTNRVEQEPYWVLNAQTWWRPQNTNFTVTLWATNLTNEAYIASAYITGAGDAVAYAPPRAAGVKLGYDF